MMALMIIEVEEAKEAEEAKQVDDTTRRFLRRPQGSRRSRAVIGAELLQ
jgi:hypothetical protein